MKRVFKFEKGQRWDGDETIFQFIEDVLLPSEWRSFPEIKQKTKITIIAEKEKSKQQETK